MKSAVNVNSLTLYDRYNKLINLTVSNREGGVENNSPYQRNSAVTHMNSAVMPDCSKSPMSFVSSKGRRKMKKERTESSP